MNPPRIGMKFADFRSFEKYFSEYQDDVKQAFTIFNSTTRNNSSVRYRNIDEKFPYYNIVYTCYYGKKNINLRALENETYSKKVFDDYLLSV